MREFAALYDAIDSTTSTNLKVEAMSAYFARARPADAAWAVYFLSGRKLKRLLGSRQLREWAGAASGLPAWLFEETYSQVGDLAETIALLCASDEQRAGDDPLSPAPASCAVDVSLHHWIEDRLLTLKDSSEEEQRTLITGWWETLPYLECLVINKLMTGSFRVGVSQTLLTRALAKCSGLPVATLAHRLMGTWHPGERFWGTLNAEAASDDQSRPYPFFLAAALEDEPDTLGSIDDWQVEWKWDGIRAQLIRRGGATYLWSRGEDLLTERFPEVSVAASRLPDGTVLDGELLAWNEQGVMPFAVLQTRIGRKKLGAKLLETSPVKFLAYDVLEIGHADIRATPLSDRRALLDELLAELPAAFVRVGPLAPRSWQDLHALRTSARERLVEGLMLKRRDSAYGHGRQRGAWWKWKIAPYTIDAVMLYAQPGHGRRASLYTDYTFGVWDQGALVPVAKAYSGLRNEEITRLDRWIRHHTIDRFGPVRAVEPVQVFELAFEGINTSTRHKSGVAVRFPRILRWRTDKPAAEADTLAQLRQLGAAQSVAPQACDQEMT